MALLIIYKPVSPHHISKKQNLLMMPVQV